MFRFTIRDVLYLTVALAIALGIWCAWRPELERLKALREAQQQQQLNATPSSGMQPPPPKAPAKD